ncbi:MAG: valine--tRNA ligase, partial [bacterium]|nr:valine--tRNA ligase [bacterium]
MDKASDLSSEPSRTPYDPQEVEKRIYSMWDEGGYFTPKFDPVKRPFTILLPLPNANDPIHMGHALFTVEDILARYHRMLGEPTLWLPGADHAGIETQFVFEKKLAKEGKSRFDFDRETLYRMISDFVEENKHINRDQLKRLGFSLDWTRYHYSLEPEIVQKVLESFKKLHDDGLVYRGERIVNFCTKCGTAFSDLEIEYVERKDPLYYIKYGPFILATTRPETKFGDTAVAFHPGDKRYEKYLGQEVEIMGVNGPFKVKVIADKTIDPKFGTGIEKVTPAHDALDFEIAQRHNLPIKKVINRDGRLNELTGKFAGLKIMEARKRVFEEMEKMGLIDHIDENYVHAVATCYKCGTTIEPMVIPQWFVKIESLAKPAIKAVKDGKTKIVPKKRFERMYFDWLENIHDWNISRQIVWGPRIPVWYCLDCNPDILINFIDKNGGKVSGTFKDLKEKYDFDQIKNGLQSLMAPQNPVYSLEDKPCPKCGGNHILQETDTFDTWFLSGQWPLTTLGYPNSEDFRYFYPTSVLDTLWDILFFWVARMMMFGLYLAKDVPFKVIHIHARVVDKFGKKMSKSKGNVINPIEIVDKYGADALRMALIIGIAPAGDVAISEEKVKGMRNFCNKIWNAARYVLASPNNADINAEQRRLSANKPLDPRQSATNPDDQWILDELDKTIKSVTKSIESYRFGQAAE